MPATTPTNHVITISVVSVGGTQQLAYADSTSPGTSNPGTNVKVQTGDTLSWTSPDGAFAVHFKDLKTPCASGKLVTKARQGNATPQESAKSLSGRQNFDYFAAVAVPGGDVITDDPRIIIDNTGGGGGAAKPKPKLAAKSKSKRK